MPVSESAVLDALRTVQEPELQRDVLSLNMINNLKVSDAGEVSMAVGSPPGASPDRGQLESEIKAAVIRVPGVKRVVIEGSAAPQAHAHAHGTPPGAPQPQMRLPIKHIVGVASGKGGVGKSTVAVNLAAALSKTGARVGLLDADIYGPNIPLMLGLNNAQPEVTAIPDGRGEEIQMIVPLEAHGLRVMSMGFLINEDQPVVWRGPMLNSVLRQFLEQVLWGDLDYLIVDLPPGTGDVQISLIQLVQVTGIVHVTTPQEVALQDVRKGIMMFRSQNIPLLGIVENMSYFHCPHCGERTDVFSHGGGKAAAEALDIKFLGDIPLDIEVREQGDAGLPIVLAKPDSPQAKKFLHVAQQLEAILPAKAGK
jgi:ATP-binding protein involved in chromosome partitioning